MTPRRHQSGAMDFGGRISKRGDRILRHHLYEAANSILTRVKKPPFPHVMVSSVLGIAITAIVTELFLWVAVSNLEYIFSHNIRYINTIEYMIEKLVL